MTDREIIAVDDNDILIVDASSPDTIVVQPMPDISILSVGEQGPPGVGMSTSALGYVKRTAISTFVGVASIPWSDVSATPTTIAGYGITDAFTRAQADTLYLPIGGTAVNSSALLGNTWASPAAIGTTTPAAGTFTTLRVAGTSGGLGNLNVMAGVVSGTVKIPAYFSTDGVTRLAIDTTQTTGGNPKNAGFGLYQGGSLCWSLAHFLPSGTNTSFVFFNDQTGTSALFINGDTSNVIVGGTTDGGYKLRVIGSGTSGCAGFNGSVSITGVGDFTVAAGVITATKTQNAASRITLANTDTTASGAAQAELFLNNGTAQFQVGIRGSATATFGALQPSVGYVYSNFSPGVAIMAVNVAGQIFFATGSNNARWQMQSAGHFIAATDNAYDIGASGASRPRNVFVAGGLCLKVKAGVPADADFTNPTDGMTCIDSTDSKIYARIGGAWKSVVLS